LRAQKSVVEHLAVTRAWHRVRDDRIIFEEFRITIATLSGELRAMGYHMSQTSIVFSRDHPEFS
jgi:hypothetical protein